MKDANEAGLGIEDLGHGERAEVSSAPLRHAGSKMRPSFRQPTLQSPCPMQTSALAFGPELKMRSSTVTSWTNG